jgi:hypothetical protein
MKEVLRYRHFLYLRILKDLRLMLSVPTRKASERQQDAGARKKTPIWRLAFPGLSHTLSQLIIYVIGYCSSRGKFLVLARNTSRRAGEAPPLRIDSAWRMRLFAGMGGVEGEVEDVDARLAGMPWTEKVNRARIGSQLRFGTPTRSCAQGQRQATRAILLNRD